MDYDLLENQLKENRKKFRVDHFDIVISEYINRFNNGEIILDPPYQRIFRWGIEMQSALIESILIGIPLPPIFAFSNANFEWEIIDGLQRTTTLINFLKEYDNEELAPRFKGCEILTELNGKTLQQLPSSIRSALRNARLRIELVEDTADSYSQYLLFSRLNNNGEPLSPQELRNFLIYKLNSSFYNEITALRNFESFKNVLSLSKKRVEKQEDIEYVIRFFLCRNIMIEEVKAVKYPNVDLLITTEIKKYLTNKNDVDLEEEYSSFKQVYNFLFDLLGDNGFRYYHPNLNSAVNTSIIGPAISTHLEEFKNIPESRMRQIIEEFFLSEGYKTVTASSYSPPRRFFKLSEVAYSFFSDKLIEERNNE